MAAEIPGYKIVKTLGKGGMATVYLAVQDIFEREVALKVMSKALTDDPTFGQRFMREAQIVSKLIHPNIVTVYDVGLSNGAYYLSMEYIDGSDLKHARKNLSFMEKIQAVKHIASALDVSGSKGYVHRDIKPENIMIERATHRAVLMDFGIARASEADISVTQAGTAIGTPHYMSPEQAKGNDVDPRADLYSLGVVLFYLTAGYVPYEGDSAVAIGIRHITEAVPELPSHLRELQWFIDKAMAKSPDERFQSGAEFIAALDDLDLDHIAEQFSLHNGDDTTDYDTPTVVSEHPVHRYGDSSQEDDGPEDFTLSFKTQEPPSLNLKWPFYVAGGTVATLTAIGIYLVASYEPSHLAPPVAEPKSPNAQSAVAALVLGKPPKLSQEQRLEYQQLIRQLESANQAYQNNAAEQNLRRLVDSYRAIIALVPNAKSAEKALNALADEQVAKLEPQFNSGDFKAAQRTLASVLELFPGHQSPAIDKARAQMTLRSKLEKLLEDGQRLYRRQDYVEPAGKNAAAAYQEALVIAPALKPAHEGLERIAKALVKNAAGALREGNLKTARYYTNQALTVHPNYIPALEMESDLLSSASIEEKTEALLEQAERYTQKGNYYAPLGRNAYETYNAILALDRRNTLAQQRRDQLTEQFKNRAQASIELGDYRAASAMADEALNNFPKTQIIQAANQAIYDAIAKHQYEHQPRIDRVRTSGVPNIALDREQPRTIAVSDKIFVKFDYHNFTKASALLTAKLYHEDNLQPLGAKQLHVKGSKGNNEFVFDLARGGAQTGLYRIEIVVAGKILGQLSFRIG
ncbi:MAG TPA: protein kinase [Marinagarivorans sp.]